MPQLALRLTLIEQYDYEVVQRYGRRHGNADGLSQRPVRDELQTEDDEENEVTSSDQIKTNCRSEQLLRIQAIKRTVTELTENTGKYKRRQDKWERKHIGQFLIIRVPSSVTVCLQRKAKAKPFTVHNDNVKPYLDTEVVHRKNESS